MTTKTLIALALLSLPGVSGAAIAQQPRDGAAVLERMRAAYAGKWYHTLTFTQKTTVTRADGSIDVSTWYESMRHTPATGVQLRIDVGKPSLGNGMLYTADSSWRVKGGLPGRAIGQGNEFLPLIEGVYVQPVARTMAELAHTGMDMSRVQAGRWRDRSVWIVGATAASDTTSPQFWVDQERNVVVRIVLRPVPTETMDIALDGYVPVGPAWLATKISMVLGARRQTEEYSGWKTNVDLPAELFNIAKWIPASHWADK